MIKFSKIEITEPLIMVVGFVVSIFAFQQKSIVNYDKLMSIFIALSWFVIWLKSKDNFLQKIV